MISSSRIPLSGGTVDSSVSITAGYVTDTHSVVVTQHVVVLVVVELINVVTGSVVVVVTVEVTVVIWVVVVVNERTTDSSTSLCTRLFVAVANATAVVVPIIAMTDESILATFLVDKNLLFLYTLGFLFSIDFYSLLA